MIWWQPLPEKWSEHPCHEHNRLLTSIVLDEHERKLVAEAHCKQLATAKGPVAIILPQDGLGEWDRAGADLHNAAGLAQFMKDIDAEMPANVDVHKIDCHINDAEFAQKALEIFDISKLGKIAGAKVTEGRVERGSGVRLLRDDVVIHEGELSTLKRFKDEVPKVQAGMECGMGFLGYHDLRKGDQIECFTVEMLDRKLD